TLLPQALVSGVLAAGLYALVAVGLALAIGVIGIVNFAHGEFFMVGAFLAYQLFVSFGFDPLLSILFVAPVLFLIGAALYASTIRFVLKAPELNQMLLTFGIGIVLQNLALMIWGGDPRSIGGVSYRAVGLQLGSVSVGLVPLGSFVISVLLVGGLYLMLARTPMGRAMRAVAQNRVGAGLVGLEVNRVYLVAFGLSALLAGIGGVMIAVIQSPTPTVGLGFTLKAFAIVVLAGLGNIRGIVSAAIVVALAESLVATLVPNGDALRNAVFFALILGTLVYRSWRKP
ncbi:MAG TPA: branched-chain amino acid ABC transporter permease, partial [Trueperaceae bacterium]|nr:branched-chain amino acid ABC transporter permease [Trueperaceae bacterium]